MRFSQEEKKGEESYFPTMKNNKRKRKTNIFSTYILNS